MHRGEHEEWPDGFILGWDATAFDWVDAMKQCHDLEDLPSPRFGRDVYVCSDGMGHQLWEMWSVDRGSGFELLLTSCHC